MIIFLNKHSAWGGVSNYYRTIKKYNINNYYYYDINHSLSEYGLVDMIKKYILSISKYYHQVRIGHIDAVVFNPSFSVQTLLRDAPYHLISTFFCVKQIIFFRGWGESFANKIDQNQIHKLLFIYFYRRRAEAFIVLSSEFKSKLREWNVTCPIYLETTIVDEEMMYEFNPTEKSFLPGRLLFLSRVENDKGILNALEAYLLLNQINNDISFNIAGRGKAMNEVEKFKKKNQLDKCHISGYVNGKEKIECFKQANLFIFPSTHGEGMPNSVLEAMAFGLPIITTRVGGIPDFFEEGKMGLFLDNTNPQHIADKIQYLLDRPELMKEMSFYNYEYAKEHFYAGKVAKRLDKIIQDVIAEKS